MLSINLNIQSGIVSGIIHEPQSVKFDDQATGGVAHLV